MPAPSVRRTRPERRDLASLEEVASTARSALLACSLDSSGQQARLAEWREVLARTVSCEETSEGVQYSFVADAHAEGRIRDLAAAEHGCCSFLEFEIQRHMDQVVMTVTARPDGLDVLRVIFPTKIPS